LRSGIYDLRNSKSVVVITYYVLRYFVTIYPFIVILYYTEYRSPLHFQTILGVNLLYHHIGYAMIYQLLLHV